MSRINRAQCAKETLSALEAGFYTAPSGNQLNIAQMQERCIQLTQLFGPEELQALTSHFVPVRGALAKIEVVNETTLAGIQGLIEGGAPSVLALNFASAKNPGGGFMGGSQAQEESLARSSGLYPSLMSAWPFYERHRAVHSPLYSDALIVSPQCPVFRNDQGVWLEQVQAVTFISCAAPNAGAIPASSPELTAQLPEIFLRRCRNILAVAAYNNYRSIVLGAWGCGVFRNDPVLVAASFKKLLIDEKWAECFARIRFAVCDTSANHSVISAFNCLQFESGA